MVLGKKLQLSLLQRLPNSLHLKPILNGDFASSKGFEAASYLYIGLEPLQRRVGPEPPVAASGRPHEKVCKVVDFVIGRVYGVQDYDRILQVGSRLPG